MQWIQRWLVVCLVSCLGCEAGDPALDAGAGGAGGRDASNGTGVSGSTGGLGSTGRSSSTGDRVDFGASGAGGFLPSEGELDPIPPEGLAPCAERPVFCRGEDTSGEAATEYMVGIGQSCNLANFPCGGTLEVEFDEMGCAVGIQALDADATAASCILEVITAERWACAMDIVVRAGGWNCE